MKVLIVDDEMVVRVGLKSIIDWENNQIDLIGEAANGVAALSIMEKISLTWLSLILKCQKWMV